MLVPLGAMEKWGGGGFFGGTKDTHYIGFELVETCAARDIVMSQTFWL